MRGTCVVSLSALLVLGACTPGASRYAGPPGRFGGGAAREHNVLGGTELAALATAPNVYAAIERARPLFLRARPTFVAVGAAPARTSVFIDDRFVGGVETLHTLPVHAIASVRFLQPMEAYARFGQLHTAGGAIVLTMRR